MYTHSSPGLNHLGLYLVLVLAACRLLGADEVEIIRQQAPIVTLDRLAYNHGEGLSGSVRFQRGSSARLIADRLIVSDATTGDVEQVPLIAGETGGLETQAPLRLGYIAAGEKGVAFDGVLASRPGSLLLAQVTYYRDGNTNQPFAAADFALAIDPKPSRGMVVVEPSIALTNNADKPLATVIVRGAPVPVQVPTGEILFRPESAEQLATFLQRTDGEVVAVDGVGDQPEDQWHLVALTPRSGPSRYAAQMRELMGDDEVLFFSSQAGADLYATAMELWLEGYRVALNPRLQWHRSINSEDVSPFSPFTSTFGFPASDDEIFGLDNLWLYMAQVDADERRIPVAFVDQGFAADPDFRGYPNLFEVDVATGNIGAGQATGLPTVGNNFFGDKSWHGNGVVHTAGAVFNNDYGTIGTGGQVVVPMLYRMDRDSYAFRMGDAIRHAVDHGAVVVNVSGGYPCRILWTLGPDNLCSEAGRALFIGKLTAAAEAAALVGCVAVAAIPIVGPAICAALTSAAHAAVTAQVTSLFLGETKGPVEEAVAYAVDHGVPVVASAGNRLDDELGALDPFVDNSHENGTTDQWQVIPASVPGCIAVGAARGVSEGNDMYRNAEFFGPRVDIWAPIRTRYFAPTNATQADLDRGPLVHQRKAFGGTSAAAPYVSGVIADMMAVNPGFDPRQLSGPALSGNVSQILSLLQSAAYVPGDGVLPSVADVQNDTNLTAEVSADLERRRNLINPWKSVRLAAAAAGIPQFDRPPAPYDRDYGLHDKFPDFLHQAENQNRRFAMNDIAWTLTDEIGRLHAQTWQESPTQQRSGRDITDRDWLILQPPGVPGLYSCRVEARIPWHETGRLLINDRPGHVESAVPGVERVYSWVTPQVFHGVDLPLKLTSQPGVVDADFPYELTFGPLQREPAPPADPFDVVTHNDDRTNAVPLHLNPCQDWSPVFTGNEEVSRIEQQAFENRVDNLTIHSPTDEDWFALTLDNACLPPDCEGCPPELTIFLNGDRSVLFVEVYDQNGRLVTRGEGTRYFKIRCEDYMGGMPLYLRVFAPEPAAANYTVRFRWSILSQDFCCDRAYTQQADRFVNNVNCDLLGLVRRFRDHHLDAGRAMWLPFQDPFGPDAPPLADGGILPDPERVGGTDLPVDPLGRSLQAETFIVTVGKSGTFRAMIEVGEGRPLMARLWQSGATLNGAEGALIFEAATEPAQDALGLFGANTAAGANDLPGYLSFKAEGLAPGFYTLALSRFYAGTRVVVFLGQDNQSGGNFPTVENLLDPTPGGDVSPSLGPPASEPLAGGSRRLEWHRAVRVEFLSNPGTHYRISRQVTDGGLYADAGRPVLGTGGVMEFYFSQLNVAPQVRVEVVSGDATALNMRVVPAMELRLPGTRGGRSYELSYSPTLSPPQFDANPVDQQVGTGGGMAWFMERPADASGFYRLQEMGR